ncbi:quinoprotein dehydrogenase-associated SoxYZ-like carrier [Pelomonas sp. KK5]|uniref:quinoprotein dehydrogenase-associated SoxYZ-like carrier n=1 Tax=Pelomonas sp. KK5 TaxID=1855730 RepID=UPI00097BB6EA|nr:quinoprotein dehydrogenase-associated SoxYZ-like carrier [Pelomonas sp. KK5]
MRFTRRSMLFAGLGLPAGSFAQIKTPDDADAEAIWDKVRTSLFDKRPIAAAEGVIALDAPTRAEDAAVVPVAIRTLVPQSEKRYIDAVYLVIDNNPSPIAGVFHFTPRSGRADIETRVRINDYGYVRAIAELNDGSLYMGRQWVKASGGCSAPASKDAAEAAKTLGRMKFLHQDQASGPELVQLMISHPNNSGLAMDQYTRQYAPAHYVRRINVSYAGQRVMDADLDISISENPNFRFYVMPAAGGGLLKAEVEDSHDRRFEAQQRLQ